MTKEKSQAERLADISLKLDSILSFLAEKAVEQDQAGVVKRLHEIGLPAQNIARVVGISENAVNIRLTRLKQKAAASTPKPRSTNKAIASDKPAA